MGQKKLDLELERREQRLRSKKHVFLEGRSQWEGAWTVWLIVYV